MSRSASNWYPPKSAPAEPAGPEPLPVTAPRTAAPAREREGRKVLILDDDSELLDLYKKMIGRLPGRPDVRLADSATQALALLDAEPFDLFITDLRLPKIDGFQVLLSARKRLPNLKTVVMTGAGNEQYRARAYDSGIDLFIEKPTTPAELRIFTECVESLLQARGKVEGFRGIQNRSLMELVQMECLSQKSSVLKITCGSLEGRIWIANGNVIDAEAQALRGEEAFKHIFEWKTGNFETMPGDPGRERTIVASHESLLLSSASAHDEAAAVAAAEADQALQGLRRNLKPLATVRGVESLILIGGDGEGYARGLPNPEKFATWTHRVLRDFQGVGEMLKAGPLKAVQAAGQARGFVMLAEGGRELTAGMDRKMTVQFLRKARREMASHLGWQ